MDFNKIKLDLFFYTLEENRDLIKEIYIVDKKKNFSLIIDSKFKIEEYASKILIYFLNSSSEIYISKRHLAKFCKYEEKKGFSLMSFDKKIHYIFNFKDNDFILNFMDEAFRKYG